MDPATPFQCYHFEFSCACNTCMTRISRSSTHISTDYACALRIAVRRKLNAPERNDSAHTSFRHLGTKVGYVSYTDSIVDHVCVVTMVLWEEMGSLERNSGKAVEHGHTYGFTLLVHSGMPFRYSTGTNFSADCNLAIRIAFREY